MRSALRVLVFCGPILCLLASFFAGPAAAQNTLQPAPQDKPLLERYPQRVYVPNTKANTLQVIDPKTFEIVATYITGKEPHHVTPSWDLSKLYVNNTQGNSLLVIDPMTGKFIREIKVIDPYNLYFTRDGKYAIVVAERLRRLDFRDPKTWKLIKSVPIPQAGANHMGFSQDGSYLVVSTEFSGWLVKVDLNKLEVVANLEVGGEPVDVFRPPHQNIMYVANETLDGVHVIDPDQMKQIDFIPTGKEAHGILMSHDKKKLFVSNRTGGSISVIDLVTRKVTATWRLKDSPDMGQLSPDGKQLWISGRYHSNVIVIDTDTGKIIKRIRTDRGPHGLTFFPNNNFQHSTGHNGVYIQD
ncbi:MAG: cytochrome D1 domain-containing protein [Rhodospirillaceae bacterium]